ncbi:General transcription factor II-I repeat domain containing protein 2A [Dissostichus eleginoides]|uniref:General transcription factor II-I repeat domain containing protein 2A n=1 Tax=Dissostichus eleginoides TaxID=100907 RepID=A0AAD9C477_DISEL|nr:General transcription factor II-I repeat domain containing protein 2A [Dissostichus eleginoides]
MRKDAPECEKTLPKYRADIETLQQQFKKRFQDFHTMQPRIELFTNPLSAAIIEQPPKLQLEMCELQSDPFLAKRQERGISFWRLLPESRFPLLRDFALSMASMFGSTYICESNFSMMKHIKSRERNRLTDETLNIVTAIENATKSDDELTAHGVKGKIQADFGVSLRLSSIRKAGENLGGNMAGPASLP